MSNTMRRNLWVAGSALGVVILIAGAAILIPAVVISYAVENDATRQVELARASARDEETNGEKKQLNQRQLQINQRKLQRRRDSIADIWLRVYEVQTAHQDAMEPIVQSLVEKLQSLSDRLSDPEATRTLDEWDETDREMQRIQEFLGGLEREREYRARVELLANTPRRVRLRDLSERAIEEERWKSLLHKVFRAQARHADANEPLVQEFLANLQRLTNRLVWEPSHKERLRRSEFDRVDEEILETISFLDAFQEERESMRESEVDEAGKGADASVGDTAGGS